MTVFPQVQLDSASESGKVETATKFSTESGWSVRTDDAESEEIPLAQQLPVPLDGLLPRPAIGKVASTAKGGVKRCCWALRKTARLVICVAEPHMPCKHGRLSYVEAAQVILLLYRRLLSQCKLEGSRSRVSAPAMLP
jgi:hypothetical protein